MTEDPNTIELDENLKFLIICCQTELSENNIEFIQKSLSSIDIQKLIPLAIQHGILPLVYKTIKHLHSSPLTPHSSLKQLLNELKVHYQSIVQRNMLMSAELIRIMKLLEENGIEALAFKGPALSQMAYGDITLRQYGDLDILINPKDLLSASQLLLTKGYESRVSLDYLHNQDFIRVNHDISFYKKIPIELHWRLFEEQLLIQFNTNEIWTEQTSVSIQNHSISTLGIENLLVYLCMHGSKHAWERIEWITDIDRLIRTNPTLDWHTILKRASALNSEHLLLLGLSLSGSLFSTKLPSNVQDLIINNAKVKHLSKIVFDYWDDDDFNDTGSKAYYRKLSYFRMQMQESFWEKIKYFYHNIIQINSSDIEGLSPQKHSSLNYYIHRVKRIWDTYIKKS